jgi:uncharacterized protein YbjT (DUF2867 family)
MGQILVTGGTGTLGRVVVEDLLAEGSEVRVLSRRPPPAGTVACSWAIGDLRTGQGIAAAVAGIDVIVHCASRRGDVASARHLIDSAHKADSPHLVYISIVGVDRVPLGYYRSKHEVERLIEESGLPWTILRSTQFHDLILGACRALAHLPVMVVPAHINFQSIDVREVATRLVELAGRPSAGRVPDMGGPQICGTGDLARSYLDARRRHRLVLPVRLPGAVFAGYRGGGHLAPEHSVGHVTFVQFLAERFPSDDTRKRGSERRS